VQCRKHGYHAGDRKREHRRDDAGNPIGFQRDPDRQIEAGQRDDGRNRPTAKKESADRGGRREQCRLRDDQSDDAQPPGAERCSHRQLGALPHRARQHQIGEIRTRDDQQRDRGGRQHEQIRTRASHEHIAERTDKEAKSAIRLGKRLRKACGKAVELRRGLGLRGPFAQSCDDGVAAPFRRCIAGHRSIEIALHRIVETRRQHAVDGVRRTIERDGLSDHRRIAAVAPHPQAVAEHNDEVRRPIEVGVPRIAVEQRHAKNPKQVRRADHRHQ
jgi:hypothetical protein